MQKSEIKRWMEKVLVNKEISPQKWCKIASVSPTTVTEFLSGSRDFLPSITTLTKLARAVDQKIIIGDESVKRVHLSQIKIVTSVDKEGTRILNTDNNLKIVPDQDTAPAEFAVLVECNTMGGAGIYPGDYILCEKNRDFIDQNAIVLVLTDKGTAPYQFLSNNFFSLTEKDNLHKVEDVDQADIIGYGIQVIRNLK